MLHIFVIEAQSLRADKITQRELTIAFRERIDIRIPISAYI